MAHVTFHGPQSIKSHKSFFAPRREFPSDVGWALRAYTPGPDTGFLTWCRRMPVSYTIEAKQHLIRTRCVGNVTLNDVAAHFRTLLQDPEVPESLDVLLDLSELTSLPETPQLENIAREVQKTRVKVNFGVCAIVAPRDALFGMMRMFEVIARAYFREIRAFRAIEEAEAWLASGEAKGE
jgi:hypothetical protein